MPPSKSPEFRRIDRIARTLSSGARRRRGIELGIGDDAAVLRARGRLVWTIDTQVEHVHFDRRWLDLESVGYRSFQAAVSDVAAMGARPLAALANLGLPEGFSDRELGQLVRGQAEAARECACPVVGGNLSRAGELSVTTTVLGDIETPIARDGARPGDELWLLGDVGLAALGLRALSAGRRRPSAAVRACIERWRRPRARIVEGRALVGRARAALDVSDGLSGDAAHLAAASGVRVVIVEAELRAALPPALARACSELGHDPLAIALEGGEDYALLAAGPAARRPRRARAIGRIERGGGVVLQTANGTRRALGSSHDHFAKRGKR